MDISLNPHRWFDRLRSMPKTEDIVIVSGMPKSGTTAIAKLLAAAAGRQVCSDPFYQLDQEKINFRDDLFSNHITLESLWRSNRNIFFSGSIIKDPNFPFFIPEIREFLPQAQFVSIVRDPRDNIRSVLNRLELLGRPLGVDLNLANISPTWRGVLNGNNPDIPGRDYVEVLAWRWRISAEAFLRYRDACVEIRYENFNVNKIDSITELAGRLGYAELCKFDHLVDVQYQPRGDSDVQWSSFFGEEYLHIIESVTDPVMREFGYEPVTTS